MNSQNKSKLQHFAQWIAGLERRASSAGVIIENTRGEVLAVKAHYKPYWSTPGGIIDAGESPKQAAVREVYEEVGLHLAPDLLDFSAIIHRHSVVADTYLFLFKLTTKLERESVLKCQSSEIESYAWLSKHDIRSGESGRKFNRALKNWASDEPKVYIEHMV